MFSLFICFLTDISEYFSLRCNGKKISGVCPEIILQKTNFKNSICEVGGATEYMSNYLKGERGRGETSTDSPMRDGER